MKVKIELEAKKDTIDFIKIIIMNDENSCFYQDGYFFTEKPLLTQEQKEKMRIIMDNMVVSLNRLINDCITRIKGEM